MYKGLYIAFYEITNFGDCAEAGSNYPDVAIMAYVGTDSALHIPPVAMSTTLMAAEADAFPVTQYRHIKACILHSMKSRLSAIAP